MASNSWTGRESANSPNKNAVFPQISVKMPSGKGKWGSDWGDLVECFVKFPDPWENHGTDKTPLFTAFPHSAPNIPYYWRFASQSLLWGFLLKRLFALFWGNNGILWLFQKSCFGFCNFMQPGKKKFPKRANPGPYRAPFDVGYLMSSIPIIASYTTLYHRLSRVHFGPNPGTKQHSGFPSRTVI